MRSLWLFAISLLALPGVALAQSDLDRCQAATPQFPQACPCVISQAQSAGITGPTLSRLLVNDTTGVPMDVFQRYGLIYVQCIQQVVAGTAPGTALGAAPPVAAVPPASIPPLVTPTTPTPAQPSQTVPMQIPPLPIPGAPATPVPAAGAPPLVQETGYQRYPADPFVMRFRDPVPAGEWGFVSLERPGEGRGGDGVHDGQGRILYLTCRPSFFLSRPRWTLAGVPAFDTVQSIQVTVLRSNGAEIYNRWTQAIPVMGPFLMADLGRELANAIRSGSTLRFALRDGPVYEFGLTGSNAQMGPGVCGSERVRVDSYLLGAEFVPNPGWEIEETEETGRFEPLVGYRAGAPYLPGLALSCDRRIVLRSAVFGYGGFPYTGEIAVDSYRGSAPSVPVTFADRGGYIATDPIDPTTWQALAAGEVLQVTFNLDVEPGEFTIASYRLSGVAEGLAARDCANPMGERPALPTTDLTTAGLVWRPTDFGVAFSGNRPNPPVVPGASLSTGLPDIPGLSAQCNGEVFLFDGWNDPRFFLRMEIDGDPTTDRIVGWSVSRSQAFPGYQAYPFENRILNGQSLRITWRDGSGRDVRYPLTGLAAALRAAGCQG